MEFYLKLVTTCIISSYICHCTYIHRDIEPRNCHEHEKAEQTDQTEKKQIRHDATDVGETEPQITESTMDNLDE